MSSTFRKPLIISVLILLPLFSLCSSESLHKVEPGESLYSLAKDFDCSVEDLKSLNNLNRDVLYSGEKLKIPQSYPDKHIVRAGETLSGIASRYEIPQDKLISVNRMKDSMLRKGQELELIRPPYAGESWTVQKGDTLSWISLKFNISQERLKQINMLNSSSLKLGQIIELTAPRPQTLTVTQGESLWNISNSYNLSIDDIKKWNNLDSDTLINGMSLRLYPVILELSDDEIVIAATRVKSEETDISGSDETELRLASLDQAPVLNYSRPTGKRTQPSADYYEEDLDEPIVNYREASTLIKEFTEAAQALTTLSKKLKGYTIILDPGHGGLDPGAIVENSDGYGNKVYVVEDEYCYDISLRVYRDLIRHGAEVHLTVISPNQTIRTTDDASITFVNQKNEVYNSRIINSLDRRYVWPVGSSWGLDQRKEVASEYLNGIRKKKTVFISIHADNNQGDGEGTRVLYHPDESGTSSQDLAEHLSKYMGMGSMSRAQNLRVLQNNPAGASALIEVRNLAYKNNAWAIRNEELRQDDADRIVRGIVSFLNY
jgi:LysM repeat protein